MRRLRSDCPSPRPLSRAKSRDDHRQVIRVSTSLGTKGGGVRLLGAVIAGGQSRRFGSDKAVAPVDGRPLAAHVIEGLEPQVEKLVMCGREWPDMTMLADRPENGQGPLGGICAALHHAQDQGFDAVLTAGCDTLPVPERLAGLLGYKTGVIKDQPLFGFWPASMASLLDHWLKDQPRRDMRGWIEQSGAHEVETDIAFSNLNTQDDYAQFKAQRGLRL